VGVVVSTGVRVVVKVGAGSSSSQLVAASANSIKLANEAIAEIRHLRFTANPPVLKS
jgi:hypothetical protein